MSTMQQMPLALKPPRRPSFDNFISEETSILLSTLRAGLEPGQWYLVMGGEGSGKSHLLSALFQQQRQQSHDAILIPLEQNSRWQLLDEVDGPLVILDDIDAVAADQQGEMALFNALNRWRAKRSTVVMSARVLSSFSLPDLVSRLGQATRLSLKPLSEHGLETLVTHLAEYQELMMGAEMARYLIARTRRNAGDVTKLMQQVMAAALAERRPITIPLIRSVLTASD